MQNENLWGLDGQVRDSVVNSVAERIEELLARPQMDARTVKHCRTYLEILHAMVIQLGTDSLKFSKIRNWRTIAMQRIEEEDGIPKEWESVYVDVFNRLEFAVQPEEIYKLAYLSQATKKMSEDDLTEILSKSHRNNRWRNVTGILLYGHVYDRGLFLQLLEGRKAEVEALYEKIKRDKRHDRCEICLIENSTERYFPDWTMGYRRLNQDVADAHLDGFSTVLESDQSAATKFDRFSDGFRSLFEAFRKA